ncbi:hypothetical protein JRO89_XS07G0095700 [Xanthoceras sorbifolium]|uniref:Homeobox domain-containing protein n=1 Tax=Xanthoceras sorbifolium TaxID=99658 RepID=A0ABQ8HT84_9ROSI|nr:hypothetical protein JRO89_XS07G0095700 [Xanthoceras sorbifolium]
MGFDDICNTGLGLGIYRLPQNSHDHQQKKKKQQILKYDHLLPSLTLGPSEDVLLKAATKDGAGNCKVYGESTYVYRVQASSLSALSSFSNSSSVKKEREVGDEEVEELERVSNSRVSDEDEEGSPRKKLRLNKAQFATLEESFKEHSTLTPKQKQALAEKLNLRPRQVEVWFQNRRARTKLKQTEVDCELLKKCCETLTEENKRLQKELQELKSLKVAAPPLYMEMPAATLTMCPSCEMICSSGGDGSSTTGPFNTLGPKPHFFNPFTHPSAASC